MNDYIDNVTQDEQEILDRCNKYICIDQQYSLTGLMFHVFLLDLESHEIITISHETYAQNIVELLNRYKDKYQEVLFDMEYRIKELILFDLKKRYDLDISHITPTKEDIFLMKSHQLTLFGIFEMKGYKLRRQT